jgi:hypothetical protein
MLRNKCKRFNVEENLEMLKVHIGLFMSRDEEGIT